MWTPSNAEMMERSAACFEKAGMAPRGSPTHHAWKIAGELWRTQAGVQVPQEEAAAAVAEEEEAAGKLKVLAEGLYAALGGSGA